MLRVEGAGVSFGAVEALREVTFSVESGQRWVVLGPNGAGKSTLAHLLVGALRPTAGQVRFEGASVPEMDPTSLAQRVAWVPQVVAEELAFSALDVVLLGRTPHVGHWGLTSASDTDAALRALSDVGLAHVASRPLAQLSGGERRRVYLARALVQGPKLLVLDEPTAFLDVRHQLAMLEIVRVGTSAVVAMLHDVTLASRFATHALLLKQGVVLAQGPVESAITAQNLSTLYDVAMRRAEAWVAG